MSQAFANLEGLMRLSNSEGVDIRSPLLRVLTDLYIQERTHTREEEQQYIELTLRLLPAVDVATRAAVARKLAPYPLTPARVIDALIAGAPEAAAYFVNASAHPADAGCARPEAESPVGHPGEPAHDRDAGEIFLRADSEERTAILEQHEYTAAALPLRSLALPIRVGTSRRLERAALQRNQPEFARELQLSLGISGRAAWQIVQDDRGEPLLVAARALDIRSDVLLRIMLFLNPKIGESVERVFALARLYDRMSAEAVVPIVASWREEASARATTPLRPLHAPETASSATGRRPLREAAEPAARRTTPAVAPMRRQETT